MLKAKMPDEGSNISQPLHAQQANGRGPNNVRNNSSEPRKRFLASGSSDEDPYSLTPSGSSGSSGKGKGDSGSGGPANSDDRERRNRKGGNTSGSNGDSGNGSA